MVKMNLFSRLAKNHRLSRGMVWGLLIIAALAAFEIFNYSTTEFAMTDLLGDLRFGGVRWATILALAFSGIDFAGIARLFTPEQGPDEPAEVWYLLGAWLLAATMNAILTWWGVSIAIANHQTLGSAVIPRETLLQVVPVFVAIMVWLVRVLIIGTFSVAGDRLFSQDHTRRTRSPMRTATRSLSNRRPKPRRTPSTSFRPAPKSASAEPSYHPVSMKSRNSNSQQAYRGR